MSMYIFVSTSLVTFNRTEGSRDRVILGKAYPLEHGGVVTFATSNDGKVKVRVVDQEGQFVYENLISESGMYVVGPSHTRSLPASQKVMRVLHNRIRDAKFDRRIQIIDNEKLDEFGQHYRVSMYAKNRNGYITPKFVVYVNPRTFDFEHVDEIVDLFERMRTIDVERAIYYMNLGDGMAMKINDASIARLQQKEQQARAKQA